MMRYSKCNGIHKNFGVVDKKFRNFQAKKGITGILKEKSLRLGNFQKRKFNYKNFQGKVVESRYALGKSSGIYSVKKSSITGIVKESKPLKRMAKTILDNNITRSKFFIKKRIHEII